jgi:hypothetical protein
VRVFVLPPARDYPEAFRASQSTVCTSPDFSCLYLLLPAMEAKEQTAPASRFLSLSPQNKRPDFALRGTRLRRMK